MTSPQMRKSFTKCLIFLAVMSFAASFCGNTAWALSFSYIRGRVTRASDGAGLAGITVSAFPYNWQYTANTFITDSDGSYSIVIVSPGAYYVGVVNNTAYNDQYYNLASSKSAATAVNVADGFIYSGYNFSLTAKQGGNISGRVTRKSDGAGLSGISINVYDLSLNLIKSAISDSSGNYLVSDLEEDSYYVKTSNDSNYWDLYYDNSVVYFLATVVNVTSGDTTSGINFNLNKLGSITGRVTRSSDGTGIEGVSVRCYANPADSFSYSSVTTDADGYYQISGLYSALYYVGTYNNLGYEDSYYNGQSYLSTANKIAASLNTTVANINFSLNPQKKPNVMPWIQLLLLDEGTSDPVIEIIYSDNFSSNTSPTLSH